jgi:hypothetical protein
MHHGYSAQPILPQVGLPDACPVSATCGRIRAAVHTVFDQYKFCTKPLLLVTRPARKRAACNVNEEFTLHAARCADRMTKID